MKATRVRDGKTYDIYCDEIKHTGLVEYTVCEVKHPERKFFRGLKLMTSYEGIIDIDDYDTMEKAIERMLQNKIDTDKLEEERRKKLAEWG